MAAATILNCRKMLIWALMTHGQCLCMYQILEIYLQWSLRYAAKIQIQDWADAILNFAKSRILGYSNAYLANICQCTKFDENIFIYDRDVAKNRKFKMAAVAILNFVKRGILGRSNLCLANICQCTKFDQNIFIYE